MLSVNANISISKIASRVSNSRSFAFAGQAVHHRHGQLPAPDDKHVQHQGRRPPANAPHLRHVLRPPPHRELHPRDAKAHQEQALARDQAARHLPQARLRPRHPRVQDHADQQRRLHERHPVLLDGAGGLRAQGPPDHSQVHVQSARRDHRHPNKQVTNGVRFLVRCRQFAIALPVQNTVEPR